MIMTVGVELPLSNFSVISGKTRFCQRLMTKSTGVRMTAKKGGLADTFGNQTPAHRSEVP